MIEKYLLALYILWALILTVIGMPAWIGVPVLIAVVIWCKRLVCDPVMHYFTFMLEVSDVK